VQRQLLKGYPTQRTREVVLAPSLDPDSICIAMGDELYLHRHECARIQQSPDINTSSACIAFQLCRLHNDEAARVRAAHYSQPISRIYLRSCTTQ
jgi:hypothetical protein